MLPSLKPILLALALPLFPSGCATSSTPPVAKPRLAAIPQALKQDCDPVSDLPPGALTSMKVGAPYWVRDRIALGECRLRHKALANAATALEGQGGN